MVLRRIGRDGTQNRSRLMGVVTQNRSRLHAELVALYIEQNTSEHFFPNTSQNLQNREFEIRFKKNTPHVGRQ